MFEMKRIFGMIGMLGMIGMFRMIGIVGMIGMIPSSFLGFGLVFSDSDSDRTMNLDFILYCVFWN